MISLVFTDVESRGSLMVLLFFVVEKPLDFVGWSLFKFIRLLDYLRYARETVHFGVDVVN